MKYKSIVAAVVAVVMLASCRTPSTYRATDATVVVTSSSAETTFLTQYPNASSVIWTDYDPVVVAPIDWELTGWTPLNANARMAHFNQDNQNYYVLYDNTGYRVGSAYVITDFSVIPSAVNNELTLRYPGYTVSGLSRVTMGNNMAYEVELNKFYYTARVLVDDNGNVIDSKLIVKDHL